MHDVNNVPTAMGTGGDRAQNKAQGLRELSLAYTFLARALSDEEVGTTFLEALAAGPLQTGTELDAFARGLVGLNGAGIEQVRRDLAADHAACLLGMSAHPVSPYESVYTSDKHLIMQDARDQVVRAYAQAGFAKPAELHLPEDHIALELDFMATLASRTAEAYARGDTVGTAAGRGQMDAFLRKHLLVWAPRFCNDLEERAETPFYRGVAQMLHVLLAGESERLGT